VSQDGLRIPIAPEFQLALSRGLEARLAAGERGRSRYRLTNPIRFVELRSRQTVDVSAQIGTDVRQRMFLSTDQGLATPVGGDDVLTPEPLLQFATPLDSGVAIALYGSYFATNSADLSPANSRLVQQAVRGAYAYINYTNRRLLGPHTIRLAGDSVNREDLTSGTGAAATDAGVVGPDLRVNVEPNPLIVWPQSQVEPYVGYNGANFATLSLSADFQLVWVLLGMVANVEPVGRA
jgi:hypothetical protein